MKRLAFCLAAALLVACNGNNGNVTPAPTPAPGGDDSGEELKADPAGSQLSAWQEGILDIHFINTTTGECTFIIFPDGTHMLADAAGSITATGPVGSTSNTGIRSRWDPTTDPSFRAGPFIADYIKSCMAWTGNDKLDYVVNTHFHSDHFGGYSTSLPLSDLSNTYRKQSLPEILDLLPAGLLMDRGWPSYDYPFDVLTKASNASTIKNYVTAVKWHVANRGLRAERFQAGSASQIVPVRNPSACTGFTVQNIAVNGEIWNGRGSSSATATFPAPGEIEVANPKSVGNSDKCPEENHCTTVFKLSYGKFDFYHAGDAQYDGCSTFVWKDMETAAAKAAGAVDVMKADHHGVGNTNGFGFVAKNGHVCDAMNHLRPRCWIVNSWTDGHPRQATFEGVNGLLPGTDIFITNTCSDMQSYKNFNVVKGQNGHIVVRVSKGGSKYYVYTLSDSDGLRKIKQVAGPYSSR
ncbi:MAG: hypothetical protein IJU68_05650 [Bacteroidales bacterium]|nr:hypothetical protein [Bacteroidales bacterium]